MTYTFTLGSNSNQSSDFIWTLAIGEKSFFSFNIVDPETENPVPLTSWKFRGMLFSPHIHSLFDLDYDTEDNEVTFFAPEEITSILNQPDYKKETELSFDVEGFGPGFDSTRGDNDPSTWFFVAGTILAIDTNQ